MIETSWQNVEDAEIFHVLTKLSFELVNEESSFNAHGCHDPLVDLFLQLLDLDRMNGHRDDIVRAL